MPILGILASAQVGSISTSSYESIATVSGNGSSDTVTFSSIPSTYKHLQIRILGRVTPTTAVENIGVFFNSDVGSTYSQHYMLGSGTAVSAGSNANTTGIGTGGRMPGASVASNIMGVSIIDILDYQNTNKYKTIRILSGWDSNGGGEVWFASGNWRSTAAVTSIDLRELYGSGGWTSSSTFALYGIKG
jgi:hypothetical protein